MPPLHVTTALQDIAPTLNPLTHLRLRFYSLATLLFLHPRLYAGLFDLFTSIIPDDHSLKAAFFFLS